MKALETDDVERTVRLAPLGGDDVVDTVRAQVVVAELRPRQIGRVPGGIDDDGATGRALVEQGWQGVETAEMVPVLHDGAVAVTIGNQAVAAIRMQGEQATRLGTEHVSDMGEPVGGVGGHGRAAKATKSL